MRVGWQALTRSTGQTTPHCNLRTCQVQCLQAITYLNNYIPGRRVYILVKPDRTGMVCDMETAGESHVEPKEYYFFFPTGMSQAHASELRVWAGWDGKTTWKTNQRGFQFSTWVLCGCINKTDPLLVNSGEKVGQNFKA